MAKDIIVEKDKPVVSMSHNAPIVLKDEFLISLVLSREAIIKISRHLQAREKMYGEVFLQHSPSDMLAINILKAIHDKKDHLSLITTNLGHPY